MTTDDAVAGPDPAEWAGSEVACSVKHPLGYACARIAGHANPDHSDGWGRLWRETSPTTKMLLTLVIEVDDQRLDGGPRAWTSEELISMIATHMQREAEGMRVVRSAQVITGSLL